MKDIKRKIRIGNGNLVNDAQNDEPILCPFVARICMSNCAGFSCYSENNSEFKAAFCEAMGSAIGLLAKDEEE